MDKELIPCFSNTSNRIKGNYHLTKTSPPSATMSLSLSLSLYDNKARALTEARSSQPAPKLKEQDLVIKPWPVQL